MARSWQDFPRLSMFFITAIKFHFTGCNQSAKRGTVKKPCTLLRSKCFLERGYIFPIFLLRHLNCEINEDRVRYHAKVLQKEPFCFKTPDKKRLCCKTLPETYKNLVWFSIILRDHNNLRDL